MWVCQCACNATKVTANRPPLRPYRSGADALRTEGIRPLRMSVPVKVFGRRCHERYQLGSCINVSGLRLERDVVRAIMDVSAPAFSLVGRC
jgi:hypothetical protein